MLYITTNQKKVLICTLDHQRHSAKGKFRRNWTLLEISRTVKLASSFENQNQTKTLQKKSKGSFRNSENDMHDKTFKTLTSWPLSKQHIGTTFCQDIRNWNQYIDLTSDLEFLFCQFSLNEVKILRFEIKNKISM